MIYQEIKIASSKGCKDVSLGSYYVFAFRLCVLIMRSLRCVVPCFVRLCVCSSSIVLGNSVSLSVMFADSIHPVSSGVMEYHVMSVHVWGYFHIIQDASLQHCHKSENNTVDGIED